MGTLTAIAVLCASVCARAPAQTVLSDYLAKRGWDAAKYGQMIVLEPEAVKSKADVGSLSAFDRQLMHAGGLSVIAPTEMVLIDDSFSEPPNLYDGLDRRDKILYLLTLLDDQQWTDITTRGVSMGDLKGEQRAVMKSLLPNPFRWIAVPIDDRGQGRNSINSGTVPEDELGDVRLKLDRGLAFQVKLRNGGETTLETTIKPGSPGELVYERNWDDRGIQRNPYGMHAKTVEPNQPKKSDLNYASSRLNARVSPPASGTVKEALQVVSKATGLELHADLRVAHRELQFYGSSCRAGDLLQGLALTITGAYRKVGPAFVLTSDLEGSGGRMVKFAVWEATAEVEAQRRSDEWTKKIAQSGHIPDIKFSADSPYAPNDAMKDELAKKETQYTKDWVDSSTMTAGARQFLSYCADMYKLQPMDTSKVGLSASIEYRFILPDGQAMQPEGELGEPWSFYAPRWRIPGFGQDAGPPPYSVIPPQDDLATRPAIISAPDPETATQMIDFLRSFGFPQVWLQTTRQDVLQAAIDRCKADSIRLRLVIRPWELGEDSNPDDEDMTILGETGEHAAIEESGLDLWKSWTGEWLDLPLAPYRRVSPSASSLSDRWDRLAKLARTPGVSGIVYDDLLPPGYEGEHVDYLHGNQEKPLGELVDFGYSVNARLAFLRAHSIDPIDVMLERLMVRTDLRQPFFPDNATQWVGFDDERPDPELRAAALQWDADRAAAYKKAYEAFVAAMPTNLPARTLTTRVRKAIDDWDPPATAYVDWPDVSGEPGRGRVLMDWITIYRMPASGKEDPETPERLQLRQIIGRAQALAIDLRQVPLSDLADVLTRTFRRVPSPRGY